MSTKTIEFGVCKFCGQQVTALPGYVGTQEEADLYASENCTCADGAGFRQVRKNIQLGRDQVDRLFGPAVRDYGGIPLAADQRAILKGIVDLVATGGISGATISFGDISSRIASTAKGSLRVVRTITHRDAAEV